MKIRFTVEKETKNTVRFQEVPADKFAPVSIGVLYVQKSCLGNLGYKEGQELVLELAVAEV